jgi:hypothetical protein
MWKGGIPPEAGEALYAALSAGQRRLLKAAGISIDWHRVKRITHIKATDWRVRKAQDPTKVTAELWEWPRGNILELSAKTAPQNGSSTMQQLRDLALASGLAVEEEQQPKTSFVLRTATGQVRGP